MKHFLFLAAAGVAGLYAAWRILDAYHGPADQEGTAR